MNDSNNQCTSDDQAIAPSVMLSGAKRPERAGPAVAAAILAIPAAVFAQVLVVLPFMAGRFSNIDKNGQSDFPPGALLGAVIATEVTFALFAFWGIKQSKAPLVDGLTLHRPRTGWRLLPLLVVSSLLTYLIGASFAGWLITQGWLPQMSSTPASMLDGLSPAWKVAFLIAMSVGPGLAEELLYRGYVQTRLLRVWRPSIAIPTASLLFACAHLHPAHVVGVIPISLWLGFVAYRTGSIQIGRAHV